MKRIAQKEVLNAIKDSAGIMSVIARRLNCNWNTARTYCNKWESTKLALQDETETTLDNAELKLIDAIKAGDTNLIKWYLSTKGKDRGYTTEIKTDLQTTDNKPLRIIFEDSDGNELFNNNNVEINA